MQMSAWVRKPQDGGAATLTQLIRPACQWKQLLWSFYVQTHSCQEASGRKRFRDCQMIRTYFAVQKGSPSLPPVLGHLLFLPPELMFPHQNLANLTCSWKLGPNLLFIEEIFLIPQPGQTCSFPGPYRFALTALAMLCTEVTTLDVC